MRASAGLGFRFESKALTNALNIECYFNLAVAKQRNEVVRDFQINIGVS